MFVIPTHARTVLARRGQRSSAKKRKTVDVVQLVAAGDETTISSSTLTPGTHLFICAIHPWMHETVVVH